MKQIRIGALLSYISIIMSSISSIMLTPLILSSLGQSQFGLYNLVGTFIGYMALMDLGLGNTIIRYIAKYRAEHDRIKEENFLAVALAVYSLISLCILVLGYISYIHLDTILGKSLTYTEISEAKLMYAILIFNLVVALPLNSFSSVIAGYEIFVLPQAMNIMRTLIRSMLLYIFMSNGHNALAIVATDTALNLVLIIVNMIYAFKIIKIKVIIHDMNIKYVREILGYSFYIFVAMVVDQIYWRVGQLILGITLGTIPVAIYSVSMQVINYYIQFSIAISNLYLPHVTKMVIAGASNRDLTNLLIRTGRIQLTILLYILGAFILFGSDFIRLWAGNGYQDVWLITIIIMVPLTIPLIQNVSISILQAKNMHKFRAITYLGISIVNTGLSIMFIHWLGIVGAAIGTTLSLIVGNIVIMNIYYEKRVGIETRRFFAETMIRPVLAGIVSVCIGYFIVKTSAETWNTIISHGIIYSIAYVSAVWFISLTEGEKTRISDSMISVKTEIQSRIK